MSSNQPDLERSFEKPWHARLFAMTISLHESGTMSWPQWSARLGEALSDSRSATATFSEDQYFEAWSIALEQLLHELGMVGEQEFRAEMAETDSGLAV